MTHLRTLLATIILSSNIAISNAETLRGRITDANTGEPLIGATVRIVELSGVGGVADFDGNYTINIERGGRYTIEANFVGYEPMIMKEILVSGAKECVIDFLLREDTHQLGEVVVKPRINKLATVNPNVLTGGVMLSMEEATRFAGGYNDPARLVMAYAGVSGESDGSGLSVHGNAPERMQYRIEGVEVFTPNHYNDLWNAGAGLVSALNANVIGNSDFFTSAFNANYSNALGGVFDVKMRPGNNTKHENILQIGSTSEELTLEGPISKEHKSSYIINYRYGFSTLVDQLGLIDTDGAHLGFQDFSMKLNFPTKMGSISIFGLGFHDSTYDDRMEIDDVHSAYDASDTDGKLSHMLAGVSYKLRTSNKWSWSATLAYNMQHIGIDTYYYGLQRNDDGTLKDPLTYEEPENKYLFSKQKQNEDRILFSTELSKQISPLWFFMIGAEYSHRAFNLNYRSVDYVYAPESTMQEYTNMKDNTSLMNIYWQNLLKFNEKFSISTGIAFNYFKLSKDLSVEPRFSLKWEPTDNNSFSMGYGLHSMTEKLDTYFYKDEQGDLVNKDLGMTKSHHLLFSYMYKINDNLNVRANAFYQYGFNTPVGVNGSTYCVTNRLFAYTDEPLSSKGNTRNYGADITLEHYMSRGFYGQTNFSLYKSEYRGVDKIWRNQLYDRGFMYKILAGKEWMVGREKKNVLNVSAKYSVQGGLRYTPIDVDQMNQNLDNGLIDETPVYKENEAFSKRFDATGMIDLTISFKINCKRVSHTIAFEGVNILDAKAPLAQRFDMGTRTIRTEESGISLPNIFYRLDF